MTAFNRTYEAPTAQCSYHGKAERIVGHIYTTEANGRQVAAMPVCARAYGRIEAGFTAYGHVNGAGQTINLCDCMKADYCPQYGRRSGPMLGRSARGACLTCYVPGEHANIQAAYAHGCNY